MKDCPCGSHSPFTDCCGPLLRGTGYADTAEDLMRSRFTAFATGAWDYLERTVLPDERADSSATAARQEGIRWTQLDILETREGGPFDTEGEVSFAAHYTENGEEKVLRERSQFIRRGGKWFYSREKSEALVMSANKSEPEKPFKRDQPKVGRNDPCPCGSGKKFKKCCSSA